MLESALPPPAPPLPLVPRRDPTLIPHDDVVRPRPCSSARACLARPRADTLLKTISLSLSLLEAVAALQRKVTARCDALERQVKCCPCDVRAVRAPERERERERERARTRVSHPSLCAPRSVLPFVECVCVITCPPPRTTTSNDGNDCRPHCSVVGATGGDGRSYAQAAPQAGGFSCSSCSSCSSCAGGQAGGFFSFASCSSCAGGQAGGFFSCSSCSSCAGGQARGFFSFASCSSCTGGQAGGFFSFASCSSCADGQAGGFFSFSSCSSCAGGHAGDFFFCESYSSCSCCGSGQAGGFFSCSSRSSCACEGRGRLGIVIRAAPTARALHAAAAKARARYSIDGDEGDGGGGGGAASQAR